MLLEPTPTPALSSLAPRGPPSWCGVLGVVNTVFPSLPAAAYQRHTMAVPVGTTRKSLRRNPHESVVDAHSGSHPSFTSAPPKLLSAIDPAQQGTCRAHISSHRPLCSRNPYLLEVFSELCCGLRCCLPGLLSSAFAHRRQLSHGPLGSLHLLGSSHLLSSSLLALGHACNKSLAELSCWHLLRREHKLTSEPLLL